MMATLRVQGDHTRPGSELSFSTVSRDSLDHLRGVDLMERLPQLRELMAAENPSLDYYIIPSQNVHGSQLVGSSERRLGWISGFTGSFGIAVVSKYAAYLFVDPSECPLAQAEVSSRDWQTRPLLGLMLVLYGTSRLSS
ncbi:hypothetical protein JAAARDRAFT_613252 [Jaapia argillacea MUCL 33604]|uniref:Creatinase N-terminal domain-containing protein n=1 Tax=Jaapia argillacea MUCL 33604 TaxID=933084 RepID=A0A067PHJ9_9AGAM|nr:hypothetical protein JAAARDRAFT_613252 [Jaapia argillacea MUCL 33604]